MIDHAALIAQKSSELFYRSGFADVPVEGIIEHAGVSRRTFYKYFRDKEDAVCAALDHRAELFCEMVRNEVQTQPSLRGSVSAVFEVVIQWHQHHGYHGCLFQAAVSQYGHKSARIRDIGRIHKEQFRRLIASIFAERGHHHASDFAEIVTLLIEGAVALGNFGQPVVHIRRAQDAALELLRDG